MLKPFRDLCLLNSAMQRVLAHTIQGFSTSWIARKFMNTILFLRILSWCLQHNKLFVKYCQLYFVHINKAKKTKTFFVQSHKMGPWDLTLKRVLFLQKSQGYFSAIRVSHLWPCKYLLHNVLIPSWLHIICWVAYDLLISR